MAGPVLVVGASGLLGGRVAARLLESGVRVRGMSRDPARLRSLEARGGEVVRGDLLDRASLDRATAGVSQIYSTANSFMGRGATSPTRVDVPGYRNLLEAARAAGVARLVHTSSTHLRGDSPVDFFRVKVAVDELIRAGGIPWVLLRPTAFLEVWVGMLLADARAGKPVRLFGDGRRVSNFIAVDDVASYAVKILADPGIVNEVIEVGGPSTLSQQQLVDLIERHLGRPVARQAVPRVLLRILSLALRPVNEMTARLMALGYWASGVNRPLPHWEEAARRFGIPGISAEQFVAGALAS